MKCTLWVVSCGIFFIDKCLKNHKRKFKTDMPEDARFIIARPGLYDGVDMIYDIPSKSYEKSEFEDLQRLDIICGYEKVK